MGKSEKRRFSSLADGKVGLFDAIQNKSVDGVREALLFLSTTLLAVPSGEEPAESNEGERLCVTVRVDFNVCCFSIRNNNDNSIGIGFDHTIGGRRNNITNILSACIGPDLVHTELVKCLLTPQTLEVSEEHDDDDDDENETKDSSSEIAKANAKTTAIPPRRIITITTNARETLLENTPGRPGLTPLALACQDGNLGLARLLLEHGADPNACGNDGLTPLVRMSRTGNLPMVELLLVPPESSTPRPILHSRKAFRENRWGTDVCHYDQQSMNALMHACSENHIAIAKCLAATGDPVHALVNDYKVDPALWYASAHGSTAIVEFLVDECGAKVSYRKRPAIYSSTPLEEACQWGHFAAIKALLRRSGTDPRSPTGRKGRSQALSAGHSRCVDLLDATQRELETIESGTTVFSIGILPLLLSRNSRKFDVAHRILRNHAGDLFGR